MSNKLRFKTVIRSWDSDEVVGKDADGFDLPIEDWTPYEVRCVAAAMQQAGISSYDGITSQVALGVEPVKVGDMSGGQEIRPGTDDGADEQGDQGGQYDKGAGSDGSQGDADGEQGQGQGQGQGDADGDADGEGQGEGQGESDSDGDSDGDGDADSDSDGDGSDPEDFKFETQEPDPSWDETFGDDLADDLWKLYRPRVDDIATARAVELATAAVDHVSERIARIKVPGGSGSGGSGPILKINNKIVGKLPEVRHHRFDQVLRAMARGCHVYLPGVPGTGKSHMVMQLAEALGKKCFTDSFSLYSSTTELKGYYLHGTGEFVETNFYKAFTEGHIYLGDELDNANANVVTGLNSALANGQYAFANGVKVAGMGFLMAGTANTLGTGPTAEFAGRTQLDPASLNRFAKIYIDTDERMERTLVEGICGAKQAERWLRQVRHARAAVSDLKIKHFVTMRDSIIGARLIADGDGAFTIAEAAEMTFLGSLTEPQRAKIAAWMP